jgi:hypothetical protein
MIIAVLQLHVSCIFQLLLFLFYGTQHEYWFSDMKLHACLCNAESDTSPLQRNSFVLLF